MRAGACRRTPHAEGDAEAAIPMPGKRLTIVVHGFTRRVEDATAVERSLARQPGVLHATVNPATEVAYVAYDPAVCDAGALVAAIRRAGFRAEAPVER
jgi:cation transport ATPase